MNPHVFRCPRLPFWAKPAKAVGRLTLGSVLLAGALAVEGCVTIPVSVFGGERGPMRSETIVPADHWWTRDQVLLLDLSGLISVGEVRGLFLNGSGMLVELKDRLKKAEKNDAIKAIVLRIDSPGGSVTASDVIYHELKEFKRRRGIPIVASMMDVAASGGLYVAMAADEIYAHPTTLTGGIGVLMMLPDLQGLSEKIGFGMRVVKSGENKDLGSPWSPLTEEQRALIQETIDGLHLRFLNVILEARGNRGLDRAALARVADGRELDAATARAVGLIDGVAYMDDVIERAKSLAGLRDAAVVSYEYPYDFRGNVYATTGGRRPVLKGSGGELNLLKVDLGLDLGHPLQTRMLYLWLP